MYWASKCSLGNPLRQSGYACLMVALMRSWRELWSTTPGTTDPLSPFGVVALPQSGSLGGSDIGTMRWAQTGGYGYLPNPLMPGESFLVQSYDQDDPFKSISVPCYKAGCCEAEVIKAIPIPVPCDERSPEGGDESCANLCSNQCVGVCANLSSTNMYMGPFHPRTKYGVGTRLGRAAARTSYGRPGPRGGPTLAGCWSDSNEGERGPENITVSGLAEGGVDPGNTGGLGINLSAPIVSGNLSLIVLFNDRMLAGDTVMVRPYNQSSPRLSKMEVLTDPSLLCLQYLNGECVDDGYGKTFRKDRGTIERSWKPVNISPDPSGRQNSVLVDLTTTGGIAYAVRYAWDGDCCDGGPKIDNDPLLLLSSSSDHCPLGSCPLVGSPSGLPANPLLARVVSGRCQCVPPQECNSGPSTTLDPTGTVGGGGDSEGAVNGENLVLLPTPPAEIVTVTVAETPPPTITTLALMASDPSTTPTLAPIALDPPTEGGGRLLGNTSPPLLVVIQEIGHGNKARVWAAFSVVLVAVCLV